MSETVKRYIGAETIAAGKARWGNYADLESPDGDFVRYSDYAALSKRLAETEAIAKSLLDKAPAQADEMRRMGAQVVELAKERQELLDRCAQHALRYVNRLLECGICGAQHSLTEEESRMLLGDLIRQPGKHMPNCPLALSATPHAEVSGDSGELK